MDSSGAMLRTPIDLYTMEAIGCQNILSRGGISNRLKSSQVTLHTVQGWRIRQRGNSQGGKSTRLVTWDVESDHLAYQIWDTQDGLISTTLTLSISTSRSRAAFIAATTSAQSDLIIWNTTDAAVLGSLLVWSCGYSHYSKLDWSSYMPLWNRVRVSHCTVHLLIVSISPFCKRVS